MGRALPFLIVLLAAFAFEPLLRAGLVAADYEWWLGDRAEGLLRLWSLASARVHGLPGPGVGAPALRLEGLLVLGAAALGLRAFLRRLLAPWTGPDQAALAGGMAAALLCLHPLSPGLVAGLEGRGELLGVALGCWGGTFYLRGRQERRPADSLVALALLLACGLATRAPVFWALVVAGSEYVAARRARSRLQRLRTTTTALVGALLCLLLPSWLGSSAHPRADGAGALLLHAVEGLGWILLPPASGILGGFEVACAAGLGFLAVQPAFRAARHAPRLWGTLFGAWVIALLLAFESPVRRGAVARLDQAWLFAPALVALVAGMGISASAARGGRGPLLRLVLCAGCALLARGNAQAFEAAARETGAVHADLAQVEDGGRRVLLLDPPAADRGVEPLGDSIAWLRHPRLAQRSDAFDLTRTRALSRPAFLALLRTDTFAAWRAEGLTVLTPTEEARRRPVPVSPPWSGPENHAWRAGLTQRFEPELDPLAVEAVRLRAPSDHDPEELQRLAWTARGETSGSLMGVVRPRGPELEALFDLSSSLEWRLAGPVRSLVVERGVEPILGGEWLERSPRPEGQVEPLAEGDDWIFPGASTLDAEATAAVVLLDLADLRCLEIRLEREGPRMRARGAEAFVRDSRLRDATVAWSLEYRVQGQVLQRAQGLRP